MEKISENSRLGFFAWYDKEKDEVIIQLGDMDKLYFQHEEIEDLYFFIENVYEETR